MLLFLGLDFSRQMMELALNAIDLSPRLCELVAIHLRNGAAQPPAGTVDDG
jgi:hypothetical protein